MRFLVACVFMFNVLPLPVQADITGYYVDSSPMNVSLLHLIEDKTGSLSGRLEIHEIHETGEVGSSSYRIAGSVSGDQFIFAPSDWLLSLGGSSFSGVKSKVGVTISWEDGRQVFLESSVDEREALLEALANTSTAAKRNLALQAAIEALDQAKAEVSFIKQRQLGVSDWLDVQIVEGQEVQDDIKTSYDRSTFLRGSGSDWREVEAIEAELSDLYADFQVVADVVEEERRLLNDAAMRARTALEMVGGYCQNAEFKQSLCDERARLELELSGVIDSLAPVFAKWDEVRRQR